MWERLARVPVNIKRRSVSAVRDFPNGCGIKVVPKPIPSPPVELGSNVAKGEADGDVASEASSSFKVPKEGPQDLNRSLGDESENGSAENGVMPEALPRPECSPVVVEEVKINGHVEKGSNPVDLVYLKSESDRIVTENGVKPEALELPNETGPGQGERVNGHVVVEANSSKKCMNGDSKDKTCDSKRFLVVKRRKVSAVRDFPLGCGRVSKKADSGVGHIASSDSNAFDERKKAMSSGAKVDDEASMNGDVAREKADEGVRKRDEKSVGEEVQEMDGEATVKPPKDKTSSGEKKKPLGGFAHNKKLEGEVTRNASKQVKMEVREGNSKSTIKSSKGISSDGDMKLPAKPKEMVERPDGASYAGMDEAESNQSQVFKSKDVKNSDPQKRKPLGAGVSSAKKHIDESKSGESRQNKAKLKDETGIKSPKAKGLEGEKKSMEKHKDAVEGSDSVSSAEMVKTGAKDNETKKTRQHVPESTSKVRDKSPLMRSPNECLLKDHSEKKMLIRSAPEEKLDGLGVKQVGKNAKVKEVQEARAPSDVKTVYKVGGHLVGKPVHKGSINMADDGNHLKRKLAEEEGDESLEAYADRVIVQALMSAENCPWRQGRKPGAVTPQSTTSRFKEKKVKKSSGNKLASVSSRAPDFLYKDIVNVKDDEDSPPQDGGNEMALSLYNRSHELCITMTPSVPSGQVSKCGISDEAVSRNMVKKTLRMFQLISRKLVQEYESTKGRPVRGEESKSQRVDLKVAQILKESNRWVNHGEPIIGHVPGVEVGDEFHFRVELSIIGIHRPFQGGIDYTKKNGMVLATSIVSSGGYPDDTDNSDVLIYSGSGGNASGAGDKKAGDQKLERGNLALKNSIDAQTPVRVVYGSKELIKSDSQDAKSKMVTTLTYDGLYMVETYWPEMGSNGFNVYKFQLRRMPGQPEISLKEVKKTKKSKVREGLCQKDISDGKEKIPICAVNTVDRDPPMPFKYVTKVIYPSWYVHEPPRGCDCTDGCSDSEKCACAMKNGGEIPFNFNGAIVQAKPLVYECGPSCKCPPSCHNRVSQHGIRQPLEIFKTQSRGWGVRSLYSIPSGTFVCEYIGEMLEDADAEKRVNDEYLFDIGHNYDDRTLWEGLPGFVPGVQSDAVPETDSELKDVGFTIDAAEYGNVGRFINHSCSPNLYAQNLLYDHDNKKMPHVMFFAVDNIPPLQELTYHYNYTIDQVRDSAGNIKKKECRCGSPECTGRLY